MWLLEGLARTWYYILIVITLIVNAYILGSVKVKKTITKIDGKNKKKAPLA